MERGIDKIVYAIVMGGGTGTRLFPLTADRAKPAVPFGGTFRIVDFVMSNLINSGVRDIGILTQTTSHSLEDHMKFYCNYLGGLGSALVYPPPLRNSHDKYKGTADAVWHNIGRIPDKAKVAAIFGGDHIYRMDVSEMVLNHLGRNADISVSVMEVPIGEANKFGIVEVDSNWNIIGFQEKPENPTPIPGRPDYVLASMGNYIFSPDVLKKMLIADHNKTFVDKSAAGINKDEVMAMLQHDQDNERKLSTHDFGYDVLPIAVKDGLRIIAYNFGENSVQKAVPNKRPYWKDVGSVPDYHDASMDLCRVDPNLNLYNADWPIISKPIYGPAAKTIFDDPGREGMARDSLMCVGSIISGGKIKNTILGPYSKVLDHAEVYHSVIFGGLKLGETIIGEGSRLQNVIIDSGVVLPPGTEIGFDREQDRIRENRDLERYPIELDESGIDINARKRIKTVDLHDGRRISVLPRGYDAERL